MIANFAAVKRLCGLLLTCALLSLVMPSAIAHAATASTHPGTAEGYAHPDWLVSAGWLKAHLHDPLTKVVALTPEADFLKGHIPGAVQINWPALGVTDTSPASMTKWRTAVARKLTKLGIERRDTVVIYDGGTLFAARLWWVLDDLGQKDKRILNGGLPAWVAANGKLAHGDSTVEPAVVPYRVTPNPTDLATLAYVKAHLGKSSVALVDARTPSEYVRGHISGAVNVNFPQNASHTLPHLWKSASALRRLYARAKVPPDKQVIAYCSTGVRSAVTYFTLRLIGYPDVRLYTGSWAEWSRHPNLPKVRGGRP